MNIVTARPIDDDGSQFVAGSQRSTEISFGAREDEYQDVLNDRRKFGNVMVFKYVDDLTSKDKARYTEFCAYLSGGGNDGFEFCSKHNRTRILPR
jgi:hypothetical protein